MLCRRLQTPVLALIFLLASQLGSDMLSCHAELPLCFDIFYTVHNISQHLTLKMELGLNGWEKALLKLPC